MRRTVKEQRDFFVMIKRYMNRGSHALHKLNQVIKQIILCVKYVCLFMSRKRVGSNPSIRVIGSIALSATCKIVLITDGCGKYLAGVGKDSVGSILVIPPSSVCIDDACLLKNFMSHAE